jgi:hypothetical protein
VYLCGGFAALVHAMTAVVPLHHFHTRHSHPSAHYSTLLHASV